MIYAEEIAANNVVFEFLVHLWIQGDTRALLISPLRNTRVQPDLNIHLQNIPKFVKGENATGL